MRFTEYLVEAPPGTQQWTDPQAERPDYSQYEKPTIQRKADTAKKGPVADPWETIKKAATNPQFGREFITLLGGMYQAKRRNPNVIMTMPKMITALPDDQVQLKQQMTALYNLAKSDDEAHLAQRSQELQQARMNAASKPGTSPTPGQVPAGQVGQVPSGGQVSKQQRNSMLKQLMQTINDTAPRLTTRQIKAASAALNAPLNAKRKKNARTKVPSTPASTPQQTPGVISTG
jgi:hypothetical protein